MTKHSHRTGDTIAIEGGYQHTATYQGHPAQRFWHQLRFKVCLEMLDPRAGMTILDVGCGSGVFADRLAGVPGTTVVGIDANAAAIEFARAQYGKDTLTFRLGRIDALDLKPSSFDQIAFLEVIEHIYPEQAEGVLRDLAALLKPGGRLIISTPNMRSAWPLIEWTLDRLQLTADMEGEQHVAGYHAASLTRMCAAAGFDRRSSRTLFVAAPWLAPLSWPLAGVAHRLEQPFRTPVGSLLVQCFELRTPT